MQQCIESLQYGTTKFKNPKRIVRFGKDGILLLPLQIGNRGNSEGTIPGATASPNLH